MDELKEILDWFDANRNPDNVAGMARFGIETSNALGISLPALRKMASHYRRRHDMAIALWDTGIHEARIMASIVEDPSQLTPEQMDDWTAEFDSWDICDQCCNNLFWRAPFARSKITGYCNDERQFVRRAGFVLMATLAVHAKEITDDDAAEWFTFIKLYSTDGRNFVKKAVNWALRQIGKRNTRLNAKAADVARTLANADDRTARWIGRDALRELTSPRTLELIVNHRNRI